LFFFQRKEELLQKEAASDDSYEEEDGEYSTSGTSEDHSDSDASGNEQSRRGQGKSQCHRRKGKATDARTLRMSKDDGDEKHFLERIQCVWIRAFFQLIISFDVGNTNRRRMWHVLMAAQNSMIQTISRS
jgi:hypothetical protein